MKRIFPSGLEVKITEKEPTIIWCRLDNCYYIDNNGVVFMCADSDLKADNGKRIVKIIEEEIIKEEELENFSSGEKESEKVGNEGKEEDMENVSENESLDDDENDGEEIDAMIDTAEDDKPAIALGFIEINDKVSDSDFIDFALSIDREIKRNTQLEIKFYKTKGTNTRELIAYTDKNTRLYFNAMKDANLQVKYLKDFLLKGIGKNKIDNLEYIYFESGNRIFYK